ncbi:serine hydrolase domain-containing protein [Falsibacillus albus]|nr:serine hydrolase [Falsibacillus albus]
MKSKLPRSSPEEQGVSSKAISQFLDNIQEEKHELHSLMILRHGHVITEGWWNPFNSDNEHALFSLTKSFTSIAVGFAINEGLFSLEDTVSSFFPDIEINQINGFKPIQVRDLLTLSVGHEKATMGWDLQQIKGSWIEHFLNIPLDHEPGTRFLYNTSASHMLSAIVQQVTGKKLIDFLEPRLFGPLGISKPNWQTSPDGHNTGGHGMSLKTDDIAKFGQFLLQKGFWEGRQLLPVSWIEEASSLQILNGDNKDDDWQQGYGYQFWLCRHGAYRADGAYGQFCIILPDQEAVVIMTGAVQNGARVLNLVWECLLSAMRKDPFPKDLSAQTTLRHQLKNLRLEIPELAEISPLSKVISNKIYKMDSNIHNIKEVSIMFDSDSCTFMVMDSRGKHYIKCGYQEWVEGTTVLFDNVYHFLYQPEEVKVYAKAGWKNEKEFEMIWCFIDTPFTDKLTCRFDGKNIQLKREMNMVQDHGQYTIGGRMEKKSFN